MILDVNPLMIIAGTGHRPKYLNNEYDCKGPYSDYIRASIQKIIETKKPVKIISGMALGVDTILAEIALANKIPLIAAVPFQGQESRWPKSSQEKYHQILSQATDIIFVADDIKTTNCAHTAMHARNKWMVDNCTELIAVLHKGRRYGGTYQTVIYAKKVQRPIIHIDPKGWQP
jgi:uncharacterized phage-like protein YoqJ